jgi:hypothetical protein
LKFASGYRSVLVQAHGETLDASEWAGCVDSPRFAIRDHIHHTLSRCAPLVQCRTLSRPCEESQVNHRHNLITRLTQQ